MDEFFRDIIEFYNDPENVRALEEYRKKQEVLKGGETNDVRNMSP